MAYIYDGLGTTLTWGTSTFVINKVSITSPQIMVGDKIDTSHLETTEWKTGVAPTLKDVGPIAFTGHFDPAKYVSAPIGSNETITITYPDGDNVALTGFLKELTPGEAVEGAKVTVTGSIQITNSTDGSTETAPAYTAAT